jgi:hypothetical protein
MATSIQITPTSAVHTMVAAPSAPAAALAIAAHPPGQTPTVGTATDPGRPNLYFVVGGFVVVAITALIAISTTTNFPYSPKPSVPVAGLTIFAVFFVAAQGIERLLEPIASFLGNTTRDALTQATAKAQTKVDSAHAVAANGPTDRAFVAASSEAQTALDAAAAAKAKHQTSQANRTVAFWAVASSVGIVAAALLKLYLLTVVGVAEPGRVLDVIATGLIVGAGTKPLHDLVTLITAQKEAKTAG